MTGDETRDDAPDPADEEEAPLEDPNEEDTDE